MQTLNFRQAQNLNNALNSTEIVEVNGTPFNKTVLKSGKHLSSGSFLKLAVEVQKRLRETFADVSEQEKKVFEDNDYILTGGQWVPPSIDTTNKDEVKKQRETHKDITQKLNAIQEKVSVEIPDVFINEREFIEWTKESSNEVVSILAEFLLVVPKG